MLKFQIVLIAILVCCFAFISCERTQQIMTPVTDDMMGSISDTMTGDDGMAAVGDAAADDTAAGDTAAGDGTGAAGDTAAGDGTGAAGDTAGAQ